MSTLTQCKTCNNQVSTSAQTCPHCGEPNPWRSNEENKKDKAEFRSGCLVAPLLFFVIAPIISFILKSAGFQVYHTIAIPVIAIILGIVYKIIQKKSSRK